MSTNDQYRVFGVILGAALSLASILMAVFIFLFARYYPLRDLPLERQPFYSLVWGAAIMLVIAGWISISSLYKISYGTSLRGITLVLFYILLGMLTVGPIFLLIVM